MSDCLLGREDKGAASQQVLRLHLHFSHCHPNNLVGVSGNFFLRCERCGVQTCDVGSARHESTATCCMRADRRNRHVVAVRCATAVEYSFTANGKPLWSAETFKYLGRIMRTYDDIDVPTGRRQLFCARAASCGSSRTRSSSAWRGSTWSAPGG